MEARVRSLLSPCEKSGAKVALPQVFLPILLFSSVSVIPPMLHTHLHLHVARTRETSWWSPGTPETSNAVSEIGEHWIEKYCHFLLSSDRVLPFFLVSIIPSVLHSTLYLHLLLTNDNWRSWRTLKLSVAVSVLGHCWVAVSTFTFFRL